MALMIFSLNLALAAVFALTSFLFIRKRGPKLPPGPNRLPIIGNVHQLPTKLPWEKFAQWSRVYGDLIHVDLFGQSIIIINSRKIANDLLDKRSSLYSDRPVIPILELAKMNDVFPLLKYGDEWRKQRKMIAQDFATTGVNKYGPLQEREFRLLVKDLILDPRNFETELKLRTGVIIFQATYGYSLQSSDDPMLTIPLKSLENFNEASQPGAYSVNIFPALMHLPKWLPGIQFFKEAERLRQAQKGTLENPYIWFKENAPLGTPTLPNLCHSIWEKYPAGLSPKEHRDILLATGSVLGGGLDTNISLAMTFFMNMILHPNIQRKAQTELDTVVGLDRLPTMGDRPSLPYIRSLITETYRFMPSVPLCLPHALRVDDFYEGYLLPKGAWVLPNIWQMVHDPHEFPEPGEFRPERYSGDDAAMDRVRDIVFGFGRRVCPGRLFAENSLFIIIATTLATCDILPGLDGEGREILPSGSYTTGTITKPESFKMRLKLRSPTAGALLAEATTTHGQQ